MKVALMPSQTDKVIDTSQTRLPTGCRLLNTTDAGAFASAIQQVYDSGFYETGLEDRLVSTRGMAELTAAVRDVRKTGGMYGYCTRMRIARGTPTSF